MDRKGPWLSAEDAAARVPGEHKALADWHRAGRLGLYGCKSGSEKVRKIYARIYLKHPLATLLRGNFFGVPTLRERSMNVLFVDVGCLEADLAKLQRPQRGGLNAPQSDVDAWLLARAKQNFGRTGGALKQDIGSQCTQAGQELGARVTHKQMKLAFRNLPGEYRLGSGEH
jgi:hypothetical protein